MLSSRPTLRHQRSTDVSFGQMQHYSNDEIFLTFFKKFQAFFQKKFCQKNQEVPHKKLEEQVI